ncbi:type II secretion system protein GspC [Pyxidicoccus sp. 3LFB2]
MMALIFRRYFWLVNGTFILLVALLLARTANLFVEEAIAAPLPGTASSLAPARVASEEARTPLDGARLGKLTGLSYGKKEPDVVEPGQAEVATSPVRSSLRVKLLGTLVANDAQWSFASIQDLDTQRARSLMVGDDLMGARILTIERERITVAANGREEYIDGEASSAPVAAAPALSRTAPVANPGPESGIRATGEHAYEIPETELQQALARLDVLSTQARVVPAIEDGKPVGFKLAAIRQGSLYTKIGLQNGDVLKRINGLSLDSPERMLEAFTKLRETKHIELDIGRAGGSVRKVYDVR